MASESKRRPRELSARDIRFCQLWVERGRGHAYSCWIDAGFKPRATRNATDNAIHLLLSNPEIKCYCDTLRKHAAEAAKVTIEELAAVMAGIVRADRRKLYDEKGRILLPHEWPDDVAATVEQVESDELFEPIPGAKGKKRLKGYTRKVKTSSRVAAAAKLMEWKRMTGGDKKDDAAKAPDPLVIGGDADPAKLR
jgi:phage terminase small subunit